MRAELLIILLLVIVLFLGAVMGEKVQEVKAMKVSNFASKMLVCVNDER